MSSSPQRLQDVQMIEFLAAGASGITFEVRHSLARRSDGRRRIAMKILPQTAHVDEDEDLSLSRIRIMSAVSSLFAFDSHGFFNQYLSHLSGPVP